MGKQIILTIFALIASLILFEFTSIDTDIQNYFYNYDLNQWVLDRDDRLTKFLFYDGIKQLYLIFASLVLVVLIFLRKNETIKEYKKGLIIVCLATILVPLTIGALKATTNVPCPKNLEIYDGNFPYVTVFSKFPKTFHQTRNIQCFPAAHASGGFALMALFFLFKKRSNRIIAIASATSVGWVIGSYKMLIGDHFLSHTVIAMIISWLVILILAKTVLANAGNHKSHFAGLVNYALKRGALRYRVR